jgi:hypothetical protein
VTPFGLIRLPVWVVRCRGDGHYLTLSKLLRPKATQSPLQAPGTQLDEKWRRTSRSTALAPESCR